VLAKWLEGLEDTLALCFWVAGPWSITRMSRKQPARGSYLERARIVACGALEQLHERLTTHRLVDLDRRQMRLEIDLHEATAERGRVVDGGSAELLDGHPHEPGGRAPASTRDASSRFETSRVRRSASRSRSASIASRRSASRSDDCSATAIVQIAVSGVRRSCATE
jgi:hypothetical protein